MTWRHEAGIAREILSKARMFATMPSTRVVVFGGILEQAEWLEVLRALLDDDHGLTDADAITAALNARTHRPIELPKCLHFGFEGMVANETSRDLCRHLGVDPLRLAVVAGAFSRGSVTDADRAVSISAERRTKTKPPRAAIKVRLDGQATWSAGRFTLRRTSLPLTALQGLKGMSVDQIVDHEWEGWKSLQVTSAGLNGDATVIGTTASDAKRTGALAPLTSC